MDLVKLVFAVEEGVLGDHLKEDAAIAPDVHFVVIVAIGHQTLRSSVPPGGNVLGVGRLAIDS